MQAIPAAVGMGVAIGFQTVGVEVGTPVALGCVPVVLVVLVVGCGVGSRDGPNEGVGVGRAEGSIDGVPDGDVVGDCDSTGPAGA